MSTLSATFESVPRYRHLPWEVLRAQLRSAALAILADGQRVSTQRLREHGVRGGTAALIKLREELVAAGELPPEAAARVYAPPKHQPGKASFRSLVSSLSAGSSQRTAISSQEFNSLIADKLIADGGQGPRTKGQGPRTKAQRRSRRLVRQYNSAVRSIFGRARARQIGAC
jgi:hypothetical protein